MGQQESSHPDTPMNIVQGRLKHHAEVLKRIAKMSYKEFKDSVVELNRITSSFTDRRGKQLHFQIIEGSDETLIWKATVRVQCKKVNPLTNKSYSTRDLNLRQYILVYKEITEHVSNLAPATPGGATANVNICASMILDEVEHKSLEFEEECCICMQAEARTIMPCAHKFCSDCCKEWTDTHKTCPICRDTVKSSQDAWELTDAPDSTEYVTEVRERLVGIADRNSPSDNT